MTQKIIKLIDLEIEAVKKGLKGEIIIKMNNIDDHIMIDKLYEANQSGVIIKLLVRGINCLIPGIQDMSKNIHVYRIIDDFLEHSRILIFHAQGNKKVYLTSADWMHRNLYRRLEIAFPIYDIELKNSLVKFIDFQLKDSLQPIESSTNIIIDSTTVIRAQRGIHNWLNDKNKGQNE